jgi:hypothetical protein
MCRPRGPADNVVLGVVRQRCEHAGDVVALFEAEMLVHLRVHDVSCEAVGVSHLFFSLLDDSDLTRLLSHVKMTISLRARKGDADTGHDRKVIGASTPLV